MLDSSFCEREGCSFYFALGVAVAEARLGLLRKRAMSNGMHLNGVHVHVHVPCAMYDVCEFGIIPQPDPADATV